MSADVTGERIDDALRAAADELLYHHDGGDLACRCGARNDPAGEALHAHRVEVLVETFHATLGRPL